MRADSPINRANPSPTTGIRLTYRAAALASTNRWDALLEEQERQKSRSGRDAGHDEGRVSGRGENEAQILQTEEQNDPCESERQKGRRYGKLGPKSTPVGERYEDTQPDKEAQCGHGKGTGFLQGCLGHDERGAPNEHGAEQGQYGKTTTGMRACPIHQISQGSFLLRFRPLTRQRNILVPSRTRARSP
jgi:hypothetical protein